jgi:predicted dehydrogenase
MKKIKVAVLGYGHLGKWHCQKVEAHKEFVEFVAIVEKFPPQQELAKTQHPQVKVVDDIAKVINEIDAAIIVTPTSTHFELVSYLVNNNKHVFCEKPLCSNDEEAKKIEKLMIGKKLVVQVGHSERFHEAWDLLREQIKNLKPPLTIKINRVAPFKGRATDVDVIQDLAIHDLDLVLHLFAQKPLSLKAYGHKIRTHKWDHALIHLELENQSQAFITVGRNATKELRELEVVSEDGMLSVDLFSNKILRAPKGQWDDSTFVREENYAKRDHLFLEHQAFYHSIREQQAPIIGWKDGLNAVHLVDCALKSIEDHMPVVVNLG